MVVKAPHKRPAMGKAPKTVQDVEDTMRQMDSTYGTQFTSWIRSEANVSYICTFKRHLFMQFMQEEPARVATVLRWLTKDWSLPTIAELILKLVRFLSSQDSTRSCKLNVPQNNQFYGMRIDSGIFADMVHAITIDWPRERQLDLINIVLIGENPGMSARFFHNFTQGVSFVPEHPEYPKIPWLVFEKCEFLASASTTLRWTQAFTKQFLIEYAKLTILDETAKKVVVEEIDEAFTDRPGDDAEIVDPALAMTMIEDLVDIVTLDHSMRLFEYIESRVDYLVKSLERTLAEFDKQNEEINSGGSKLADKDRRRKDHRDDKAAPSAAMLERPQSWFFPKFLTNRKLFDLQLKDTQFRRQILVQFLIIFQFLLMLSKPSEQKDEKKPSIPNKSVQFPFFLTDEQIAWVTEIRSKSMKTLEAIPPFGKRFSNTLTTVITHEKNWIKWKTESCPPFEKEPVEFDVRKKRKLEKSAATHKDNFGNETLNRLWALGRTPLETLAKAPRKGPANLEAYLEPLADQLNPDGSVAEGIEEQYLWSLDKRFNWKAYRLAIKEELMTLKGVESIDTRQLLIKMRTKAEPPPPPPPPAASAGAAPTSTPTISAVPAPDAATASTPAGGDPASDPMQVSDATAAAPSDPAPVPTPMDTS
ncbi:hypothetical protein HDU96_005478 [Phlyctochytrium bullatum]|nr:hypothetical protein HDU96_005478 [Phlyctochytrium bullatum]